MAMNGNDLGDEIFTAIISPLAPAETQAQVKALWRKIGNAIVDHIQANAEVPAGIAVSTPVGAGATSAPGSVQ